MIVANKSHKKIVRKILSSSFKENGSIKFVVKNDKTELKRIERLIDYSFEYGLTFGKVFLSEDHKSCCIMLLPEKKKTTFKFDVYWTAILVLKVIGFSHVLKVLNRESKLKKFQPKDAFYHLWYIGVLPDNQKKGIGSNLLHHVLDEYKDRPIYLETSNPVNIPWYQKHGFKIIKTLELGYQLNILKRETLN